MAQTYVYVASSLTTVQRDSVSFTEQAHLGSVGTGRFIIQDDAGTQEIVGHKSFKAEQSSCSVVTMFRGYVADRDYGRGETEMVGAGREIEVSLVDLNVRLGFKVIRSNGSTNRKQRPAETISARLTWLLANAAISSLVADNGFVDYPTTMLDEADLRGMRPGDVLSDMAQRVGYNCFVYWDEAAAEAALWFQDSNTSTDWTSTLVISNVAADIDSTTTFAASQDTQLHKSPERVVSGVWMPFKRGNVYRTRAATETTFEPRDGTAPNSNVKRRTRAQALADQFLYLHRNEEDTVTTRLRLPASKVNLVRAGQRISAKFSHFATEDYDSARYWRVLERTVTQPNNDDNAYDVALVLSPQEDVCGSVVQSSAVTASPATITLASSVTPGNLLVAVGVRSGTSAVPGIRYLGADAGFTDLGQPVEDSMDGGSEGRAWVQAKTATTSIAGPYSFDDGGSYLWKLYEISANLAGATVLSAVTQNAGAATFTGNLGTFSSARGVAVMSMCVGSTGITAGIVTDFVAMGASWTEDYDGRRDPADNGSRPMVGLGHASPTGGNLACSWDWSTPVSAWSKWSGIAVLFSC